LLRHRHAPACVQRVAKYCTAVEQRGDKYVFVQEPSI
jgi:hypothetical protein